MARVPKTKSAETSSVTSAPVSQTAIPVGVSGIARWPPTTVASAPVRCSRNRVPSGIAPWATASGPAGRASGPRTTMTMACSSSVSRRKASQSGPCSSTWNPPSRRADEPTRRRTIERTNARRSTSQAPGSQGIGRRAMRSSTPSRPTSSPYRIEGTPTYVSRNPSAARTRPGSPSSIEAMRAVSWLSSRLNWCRATSQAIAARNAVRVSTIDAVDARSVRRIDPAGVAAELEPVQPFEDRGLEAPVVHDPVPLVAGELRRGIVRMLAEQVGIGRFRP